MTLMNNTVIKLDKKAQDEENALKFIIDLTLEGNQRKLAIALLDGDQDNIEKYKRKVNNVAQDVRKVLRVMNHKQKIDGQKNNSNSLSR